LTHYLNKMTRIKQALKLQSNKNELEALLKGVEVLDRRLENLIGRYVELYGSMQGAIEEYKRLLEISELG